MKKEFQILLTAFMFYTRLNVAKWVKHEESSLKNCTKYLPFVGWIVGGASALTFILFSTLLPLYPSVILSLLISVLITGAFHEDGLADTCDGFGGGWNKDKILAIMKDSSIGTYGAIGLILLFAMKVTLLAELYSKLDLISIILITLVAHSLSRFIATTFLFTHSYTRTSEDSKAKSLSEPSSKWTLIISGIFGFIPLVLLSFHTNSYYILLTIFPAYLLKYLLGRYFQKWIEGYTGDCLGATQQLTELVFYISFLGLWKFF